MRVGRAVPYVLHELAPMPLEKHRMPTYSSMIQIMQKHGRLWHEREVVGVTI